MNRPTTKAEQRAQLAQQIEDYLARGGAIKQFKMGETGLVDGNYCNRNIVLEQTGPRTRTPVPDVVAAIESRRRAGKRTTTPSPKSVSCQPRQRRKVIYDDFGEPLRTIWVDE